MFLNCSTLKTVHNKIIFVDSKDNLIQETSLSKDFSKLYAGKSLGGVYLFFFRSGKCCYISAIDNDGKVELSDRAPVLFETCANRDDSTSIYCDGMYLSARENGTFSFVPHNKLWERISLEDTFIEIPPPPRRL